MARVLFSRKSLTAVLRETEASLLILFPAQSDT
jgi:hypothetical protein